MNTAATPARPAMFMDPGLRRDDEGVPNLPSPQRRLGPRRVKTAAPFTPGIPAFAGMTGIHPSVTRPPSTRMIRSQAASVVARWATVTRVMSPLRPWSEASTARSVA